MGRRKGTRGTGRREAYLRGGLCSFGWQRNCFYLTHNSNHHVFVETWEVVTGEEGTQFMSTRMAVIRTRGSLKSTPYKVTSFYNNVTTHLRHPI